MTLDKMISALNNKPEITFGQVVMMDPKIAEQILAALKAGQAMRKAFTGPVLDYQDMAIAMNTWDEATKE